MIRALTDRERQAISDAAEKTPGGMPGLARACGLSPQLLYQIAKGTHPRVNGATWDRLCAAIPAMGSPSRPLPPSPEDAYRLRAVDIAMSRNLPKEMLAEFLSILQEART